MPWVPDQLMASGPRVKTGFFPFSSLPLAGGLQMGKQARKTFLAACQASVARMSLG
jgi:hypothetical protein